ncbi:MAG TPA: histone deacetylase [Bryobacteraceae bacterium]|nr:histone deacetylase [Bryobacteraceae bacterium]
MATNTLLLIDPYYREHLVGRQHPERPERIDAVIQGLSEAGLLDRLGRVERRAATEDELLLCHTPDYLRQARHDVQHGYGYLSTGDTEVTPNSWEVAEQAVGGVLNAVDAVMGGKARNAFCAVRPPGHHANANRGMGFCLFNNVAIAARYAQRRHAVERVVIVDWDVHHGNGTQDLFYEDPDVFFFSTHQWPLYPGTGRSDETGDGDAEGTTRNFPFPAGSGRKEVLGAIQNSLVPLMKRFRPDLVLISAGFDSRVGDLLGRFTLSDSDFADLTREVMGIADQYARGRVVSMLEGGYHLPGLALASAAHVQALSESTE